MDVFRLTGGTDQNDEERESSLRRLRESMGPRAETERPSEGDETLIDRGLEARRVLNLVASRRIESFCVLAPEVLACSERDIARLDHFLSENRIALTVTEREDTDGDHGSDHRDDDDDDDGLDDAERSDEVDGS